MPVGTRCIAIVAVLFITLMKLVMPLRNAVYAQSACHKCSLRRHLRKSVCALREIIYPRRSASRLRLIDDAVKHAAPEIFGEYSRSNCLPVWKVPNIRLPSVMQFHRWHFD